MNLLLTLLLSLSPSQWGQSILNPSNSEYVNEVAFNEHRGNVSQVTQTEFNNRYNNN